MFSMLTNLWKKEEIDLTTAKPIMTTPDGVKYYKFPGKISVIVKKDRTEWKHNLVLHRVGAPAVECMDGSVYYYKNDVLHNASGPAVKLSDGTIHYRINGYAENPINSDEPTDIYADGSRYWQKRAWWGMNIFHRIGGPAKILTDGTQEWFYMGKRHNIDGPAIIRPDGGFEYYVDDKLHNVNGPAIHRASGEDVYAVDGVILENDKFEIKNILPE